MSKPRVKKLSWTCLGVLSDHKGAAAPGEPEEEIRRAREAIELDRRKGEELEQALIQRTRELRASEGFMGRLAEICPVGIFVSDSAGNITFVNDTWVLQPPSYI